MIENILSEIVHKGIYILPKSFWEVLIIYSGNTLKIRIYFDLQIYWFSLIFMDERYFNKYFMRPLQKKFDKPIFRKVENLFNVYWLNDLNNALLWLHLFMRRLMRKFFLTYAQVNRGIGYHEIIVNWGIEV